MKNVLLFLLCITMYDLAAQIVDIPDPAFKAVLIEDGVDTNGDGEIQVSEADSVYSIVLNDENIESLIGIKEFSNLLALQCRKLSIQELDVSLRGRLHTIPYQG